MSKHPHKLMAALLAMAAVAASGCIDPDAADAIPAVRLQSDMAEATPGQTVRFEAQTEANQTGDAFLFDFGDGATQRVDAAQGAEAEHAYAAGGAYIVTVALLDGNAIVATAQQSMHVVEHVDHETKAAASGPLANQTATATWTIPASANATHVDTTLQVANAALIGQSVVRLELVDAEGNVLASDVYTLAEGQSINATVAGIAADGLMLRMVVEAGGATGAGSSTIRFA